MSVLAPGIRSAAPVPVRWAPSVDLELRTTRLAQRLCAWNRRMMQAETGVEETQPDDWVQ